MRISAKDLVSLPTLAVAATLLVALPLSVSAQTTLTPAQQAAMAKAKANAAARAQADAKVKADAAAAANANAKLRADMAAKAKADEAARLGAHNPNNPNQAARLAAHNANTPNATTPAANPRNPWGARPAAAVATGTTAVAQPAVTTAAPARQTFWQGLMNNGSTAGATPTSSTLPGASYTAPTTAYAATSSAASTYAPTSANRASGNNTFAAGVGRFQYSNQTAVLYGCLRAGTRLFCDYDQFASSPTQANANWGATLVVPGGRTFPQKTATYVDVDGSSFPHAELNPTTGVRMMVEYDDVPESYTVVSMVLGGNRVDNVPVSNMVVQDNGNLAPRSGGNLPANTVAAGTAPASGGGVVQNLNQTQTNATGATQNATDKINAAKQKAATWGSMLGGLKNTATTKPQ